MIFNTNANYAISRIFSFRGREKKQTYPPAMTAVYLYCK